MVLFKILIRSISQGKAAANILLPFKSRRIPITNLAITELLAVEYLRAGFVVALPTDTVYGLACDSTNAAAVKDLYGIKLREGSKPLAICLGEPSLVNTLAEVRHLPRNLLNVLLPGPVTLILNSLSINLNKSLVCDGKVAIRIPDHPFIRRLSFHFGAPLALTSANLSNEPSAVEVAGFSSIWDDIPAIFDGGKVGLNHGASTVVDVSEVGSYRIVRKGAALIETINILRKFKLKSV